MIFILKFIFVLLLRWIHVKIIYQAFNLKAVQWSEVMSSKPGQTKLLCLFNRLYYSYIEEDVHY